ncbi:40S ribosomal protein S16 [Trachipleistophora hominis]|uniref:40S ribosomal protein S16 n=1 Tax=Trachipleistophora hominis TaxID=72359 RepID=L7JUQ7_TRAHO|nr:40S ribosomal protein S16 [Trachipleistophora hominis]
MQEVKTIGSKKHAKAHATTVPIQSPFSLTVNHVAHALIQDAFMRNKINELILTIGKENLENLCVNVSVRGGGHVSQVYAVRQAIAKGVVAFYGKFIDEEKKQEIQNRLMKFDKFTLVADPRRSEPKKYGGPSARAKYTKSYR